MYKNIYITQGFYDGRYLTDGVFSGMNNTVLTGCYLLDANGDYILDSEGKYILILGVWDDTNLWDDTDVWCG